MTVEIKITGADAEDAVAKLVSLAGAVSDRVTLPAAPAQQPTAKPVTAEAPAAVEETADDEQETFRAYGQSEAGKARRTKVQIAEDEEIEKLAAALGVVDIPTDRPAEVVLEKLRAASAAQDQPQISANPEDRRDPAGDDTPSDEIPPATREDVRNALAAYAEKFGMPAAQKNGPQLLGAGKISEIPDDAAAFQAAIDRIWTAIEAV